MISFISENDCCGCSACANICPQKCITMEADVAGFLYPVVDKEKCVACDLCHKSCPIVNAKSSSDKIPEAYWAINNDENIQMNSSSGGIFTLIAEEILSLGGVVFGAEMSEDCRLVRHASVESISELDKLRRSKYVQSEIGDTYNLVKRYLLEERKVLFCGTPCQIEGLRSFLGKDYNNLLCVDFICHGVPSPRVWRKYVDYVEDKINSRVKQVNFRSKIYGWHSYSMALLFDNKAEYIKRLDKDLYMKAFLSDVCLRNSCYNCKFKKINHSSDITLADLWGAEKIIPEIDDDKGISFVMIHSEKGVKTFEKLNDKMKSQPLDINEAITYNPAAVSSAVLTDKRAAFLNCIEQYDFASAVKRVLIEKLTIKLFVKKVVRKVFKILRITR